MITQTQFTDGVAAFIEAEMLPALEGWQLWVGSAALNLAKLNADRFIEPYLKYAEALGAVNADGLIDIDAIYGALKQSGKKLKPFKVELGSTVFTISPGEIDNLYAKLKQSDTTNT
jgi:hypothetical protein